MWKKICAFLAGALAFVIGLFSFLWEKEKRKTAEENLKENKENLQEKEEELEKVKKGEKAYADYKKQNEENVSRAVSGDFSASLAVMQNAHESGARRNRNKSE